MSSLNIPGIPTAFLKGREHQSAGRLAEAIACYKAALESGNYEPALDNLRAVARQSYEHALRERAAGRLTEAVSAFDIALAADQELYHEDSFLFNFSVVLLETQDVERAITVLERAAVIAPTSLVIFLQLAFAQSRDGTWEKAAASMARGIEQATGLGPVDMAGIPIRSLCSSESAGFDRSLSAHYVGIRGAWIEEYGEFRLLICESDGTIRRTPLSPMQHCETFVARLPSVDIVGTEFVLSRNIVQRLSGYNAIGGNFALRHLMQLGSTLRRSWPDSITQIALPDGAISFSSDMSSNYYHWLFDGLCRMEFIEQFPELTHLPIVYSAIGLPFVREMLEMLDWPQPLIPIAPGINRFPCLYVPSRHWDDHAGGISKQSVHWLRNRFARFRRESAGDARRIFISRGSAARRRIVNEEAVVAALSRYGFSVVELEGMSVRQQIMIFARAEIVVAPHGAGLSNLVYAPEGVVTVELASAGAEVNHLFGAISASLGGRHAILLGKPAGRRGGRVVDAASIDPQMAVTQSLDEDYSVDVAQLLSLLAELVGSL
jgi:hypothetical protein